MKEQEMPIGRRAFVAIAPAAWLAAPALAEPLPAGRRVAIGGYDPLSYFLEGQPQKGSDAFWFAFDDAVYLFKSAEHRAKFIADPEQYAPQYAGFCAGAVARGYKVEPNPEAWAILNGKLYLFQLKERVPGFKQDTAFIDKANSNWPGLKDAPVR